MGSKKKDRVVVVVVVEGTFYFLYNAVEQFFAKLHPKS